MKKLSELKKLLQNAKFYNERDYEIVSIEYDSRKCRQGSVFVAIKGETIDGHNYIPAAIKGNAGIIVGEMDFKELILPNNIVYIQVENSRKALSSISNWFYDYPKNKINLTGVTGTNGKTTLTYILHQIYESTGIKSGIIGTTGVIYGENHIDTINTTPESKDLFSYFDKMNKSSVTNIFMEVSSHALKQGRVIGIDFDYALFTNLTQDHLDYHINLDNYLSAKKILFDSLNENSIAILNGDSSFSGKIVENCIAKVIINVGWKKSNHLIIANEKLGINFVQFTLINNSDFFNFQEIEINSQLTGRFNIENLAIAIAQSLYNGLPLEKLIDLIKNVKGAPGRMDKLELKNGAIAFIDYAHTPDALEKALLTLREIAKNDKRILCVFGCGGDRDKSKRKIMGKIAGELADGVIITSDNPRTEEPDKIIEDIYKGLNNESRLRAICITNRDEAIRYAVENSDNDTIILIAGKGHERYQIIGTQKFPFDDKERVEYYSNLLNSKSL